MSASAANLEIGSIMDPIGRAALDASVRLAQADAATKNRALHAMVAALRQDATKILSANEIDMRAARERGLSGAMLDRLKLDASRVEAIARGIEDIAKLDDP